MNEDKGTIGRFELVRSLGKGSQGSVYLAQDSVLDRLVAIKVLIEQSENLSSQLKDGVSLEARISSKLQHPNIVSLYDAGRCEDEMYLVFEFVEGMTLAQRLRENGALSIAQATRIMMPVLDAVATAHRTGIVHLDLSPRNILITEFGTPKVMDFGLSRFANQIPKHRKMAVGTLHYMAPEHFLGGALCPATDVFALGSMFYEMVTGHMAIKGSSLTEIQQNILCASVDMDLLNDYPEGQAFKDFLAGALRTSSEHRYQDCSAMHQALNNLAQTIGIGDRINSRSEKHSTIEFLLRRIQRKQDFPAISRTLIDINRLTSGDTSASADELADVVLKDFALTSKLLKLANSAFYGRRCSPLISVSQAIVFLGVEHVRMTANSLVLFTSLKSDTSALRDTLTRSLLSGLIAQRLAAHQHIHRAEQIFICGLFHNLGEILAAYYLTDEFDEIRKVEGSERLGKAHASRKVLGVCYAELGTSVAATWNLPDPIIEVIRGLPPGPVTSSETEEQQLRDLAVFANELCNLFEHNAPAEIETVLNALLKRFSASFTLKPDCCLELLDAALAQLQQYSQLFEINTSQSQHCAAIQCFLEARRTATEPESLSHRIH